MTISEQPGTAIMVTNRGPRFTQSTQCFNALEIPEGSRREPFAGGIDLAKNREYLADTMTGEWLFMIDDDHMHAPDLLMRLLRRLDEFPDIDLVAPYVLRRWLPHPSVVGELQADGAVVIRTPERGSGLWHTPNLLTGLGAGCAIRRKAFWKFARPWFTGGKLTEDWTFCSRLIAAGGKCAVDLDTVVGHISDMVVWPVKDEEGNWGVSYVPLRDGDQQMTIETVSAIVGTQCGVLTHA